MKVSPFAKHFGIMSEVRKVMDPWGVGIEFHVSSARNPEFIKWQEAQREGSLLVGKILEAGVQKQFGGEPDWTLSPELRKELLSANVNLAAGAVLLLRGWSGMKIIDTDTGEEIDCPFTKGEALKLLQDETYVAAGFEVDENGKTKFDSDGKPITTPYTGGFAGALLTSFVIDAANDFEKFKAGLAEEHEKNSATSSDGDSPIG